MAITYDAPSTDWRNESIISSEPRITYPIQQNLTAIFYEKDCVINECNFGREALSTVMASDTLDGSMFTGCTVTASHSDGAAVTSNAFLVDESAPEQLGGTLVKYVKKFSTVPDNWVDYSESVFTFPGYYNDVYEANYRCPQSINATIKTTATYKKTTDPYADLDVANQMFRSIDADLCVLDYVDTSTTPTYATYAGWVTAGTLIYAAQSTLERYAGNIWVRYDHQTKAQ